MRSFKRFKLATRPRRLRQIALMSVLAGSLSLTGCELLGLSDSPQQPGQPTNQPKQTPPPKKKKEAPKEEAKEEGEYQRPDYPENLRRNPFQPVPDVIAPVGVAVTVEKRPVEPLEQYSIGQLELVAVISETAVPKAMFIDPDGFGHVIKEGDRIGRSGGIITDIRDNEVDVQETSGEDENAQSSVRVIRLRDFEIRSDEGDGEELSEAEREALERLMKTDEGRDALRASLRERAATEQSSNANTNTSQGIAPPRP
jgi:Tfp pilus assembly protein PilP